MTTDNVTPLQTKRSGATAKAEQLQETIDRARAYVLDAMTMCQTLELAAREVANNVDGGGVEVVQQITTLSRMAALIEARLDPAAGDLNVNVAL